ncbi:hypothetical protein PQR53_30065 [Paraburkholderia fungorum]|uniref:hypothetical protein n=1 Tax=Paraburkholderia fungorum TaxID=134537 RepID=UPI0038B9A11E
MTLAEGRRPHAVFAFRRRMSHFLSGSGKKPGHKSNAKQFPAAVTKTFAYWRHVEHIAVQTRNALFSAMQEHFGSSLQTFAEIFDVASFGGFVAQERIARPGLLVMTEPAVAAAERVAIVDSSGKVVSSDDVRDDLH